MANSQHSLRFEDALYELIGSDDKAEWARAPAVYKLYKLAIALRTMKLAKEFKQLAGSILHLPNETRWNSWFRLIDEALDKRASIVAIIDARSQLQ